MRSSLRSIAGGKYGSALSSFVNQREQKINSLAQARPARARGRFLMHHPRRSIVNNFVTEFPQAQAEIHIVVVDAEDFVKTAYFLEDRTPHARQAPVTAETFRCSRSTEKGRYGNNPRPGMPHAVHHANAMPACWIAPDGYKSLAPARPLPPVANAPPASPANRHGEARRRHSKKRSTLPVADFAPRLFIAAKLKLPANGT